MDSFERAVRGADVICACTASDVPILRYDWLKPGAHVTSVGFAQGGPELDAKTILSARVFVESRVAFQPFPAGAHELSDAHQEQATEIGEILLGRRLGRQSDNEITVYKGIGVAPEDAAAARLVYDRAKSLGIGLKTDL